ncbi:ATP-binding protein, partial [Flavobacterium sp.]|uniref:ATP-dependent nuclease n=1 Tax=Flavobacterium sp. TaxID=239 RepID=UPI0025BE9B61
MKIENFRGIKKLEHHFGNTNFVCLVGRGDSGKTTILDAIACLFSSRWNLTFYDTDFYNLNIEANIKVSACVTDIPENLLLEDKFGLFICGCSKDGKEIHDEITDEDEKALWINLEVAKDLEPRWYVANPRNNDEKILSAADREKFSVNLISDSIDRHFSWNKGNPLYSIYRTQENGKESNNSFTEVIRQTKSEIDKLPFAQFAELSKNIQEKANGLGSEIGELSTKIDFRDIIIKDGKVSLHNENIPLSLSGKSTKRLLSVAIQLSTVNGKGIILIDEIEQGLEPDRVQFLVSELKKNNSFQIFITTHSRSVVTELDFSEIFMLRKNLQSLFEFSPQLQNILRKVPEFVFAKKIIVCEGKTELGFLRAFNDYMINTLKMNLAHKGIVMVYGEGSNMLKDVCKIKECGFDVALFCDADRDLRTLDDLKLKGIKIIKWEVGDNIEMAICKSLNLKTAEKFLNFLENIVIEQKSMKKESFRKNLKNKLGVWGITQDPFENLEIITPEFQKGLSEYIIELSVFKS